MLVHHLGDTRTVDTFHNCRKVLETEGERSKIIILCRSTTEMTRECCKTDLLDTSRESHAEFLMRSLFLDNGSRLYKYNERVSPSKPFERLVKR